MVRRFGGIGAFDVARSGHELLPVKTLAVLVGGASQISLDLQGERCGEILGIPLRDALT